MPPWQRCDDVLKQSEDVMQPRKPTCDPSSRTGCGSYRTRVDECSAIVLENSLSLSINVHMLVFTVFYTIFHLHNLTAEGLQAWRWISESEVKHFVLKLRHHGGCRTRGLLEATSKTTGEMFGALSNYML